MITVLPTMWFCIVWVYVLKIIHSVTCPPLHYFLSLLTVVYNIVLSSFLRFLSFLALVSLLFLEIPKIGCEIQFAFFCLFIFGNLFSHSSLITCLSSFHSSSFSLLVGFRSSKQFLIFFSKMVGMCSREYQ